MPMTREEKVAKNYLIKVLRSDGYPTYAKIFEKFDFNFTSNPNYAAYLDPSNGVIVANRSLDEFQISTIIRHEILHHYLKHEKRLLDKLAKERGLDPDELDDMTLEEIRNELYKDKTFNFAADYEISNRGYTDKDKQIVRNLKLNGQVVKGLVTEDDFPDWVDLSVEEMYDNLRQIQKDFMERPDDVILGQFVEPEDTGLNAGVFISVPDGTFYTDEKTADALRQMYGQGGGA